MLEVGFSGIVVFFKDAGVRMMRGRWVGGRGVLGLGGGGGGCC